MKVSKQLPDPTEGEGLPRVSQTLSQSLLSLQGAGQTGTAPAAPCGASVPANPAAIPTTGTAPAQTPGWGQPAQKVTSLGVAAFPAGIKHVWPMLVVGLDGSVNPLGCLDNFSS